MDLTGERLIHVSKDRVWGALNDVEILKAAIPGCEEITRISDTELEATVTAKIGPVKASFKGKVELSNIDAPNSYTISGSGTGGAAGFAKGGADVKLADAPDGGTLLTYEVKAQVGGKLAQVGARLVQAAARKLSDEFFEAFDEAVSGAAAPTEAAPALEEERAALPSWAWAAALAALVVASLIYWATR